MAYFCYHKIMELMFSKYIEKTLSRAAYEYDGAVKQWAAWIEGMPGVYAQGPTVEDARRELSSVLEDHILVSLHEGRKIPGFWLFSRSRQQHAKAS